MRWVFLGIKVHCCDVYVVIFLPNHCPLSKPLKTFRKLLVFWSFQGADIGYLSVFSTDFELIFLLKRIGVLVWNLSLTKSSILFFLNLQFWLSKQHLQHYRFDYVNLSFLIQVHILPHFDWRYRSFHRLKKLKKRYRNIKLS